MKQIPLTQGQFAIVDDEDYERLNQWKWCARRCQKTEGYYAMRNHRGDTILMHREIMKCKDGEEIDHKNHSTLDNSRCNLRVATCSQNQQNCISHSGTSKYKGVSWSTKAKKWVAQIKKNRISYPLGSFNIEEKAAMAYNEKAIQLFGEFANLNRIGGTCNG